MLLLFAGALQVNSADIFSRKWTILALAILATVLSTGLVAATLLAVSQLLGLGMSLHWCLVFGTLISPTDPVSVLDVLKRVGIPGHHQATVAGESLFNDGIGVVAEFLNDLRHRWRWMRERAMCDACHNRFDCECARSNLSEDEDDQ